MNLVLIALCLGLIIIGLNFNNKAHAYGVAETGYEKGHNIIIKKAVEYLKNKESPAVDWHIDQALPSLIKGSYYADNTGLPCKWDYVVDEKRYDCDTIHHYGYVGDIRGPGRFGIYIKVANTGEFAAPDYAQVLFDQALKFWPGGEKPSLNQLPQKDGGTINIIGDSKSLGKTHIGGLPFCQQIYNDKFCPKWPKWAAIDEERPLPVEERYKYPAESERNAMIYLGWAIHLLQDITVPQNAINYGDVRSEEFEKALENLAKENKFNHLVKDVDKYVYPGIAFSFSGNYKNMGEIAEEARKLAIKVSAIKEVSAAGGPYEWADSMGLKERIMDINIKLTAAAIEKFFEDLTLDSDMFEPNNNWNQAKEIASNFYPSLTLNTRHDEDYYKIHIDRDYSNLVVSLGSEPSVGLSAVIESSNGFLFYPRRTPYGLVFELKGVKSGDYWLHIYPAKNYPVKYTMRVDTEQGTLPPDRYEENDTAETAKEFFTGCEIVNSLNIDKIGDDDFYYLKAAKTDEIEVEITFNPQQGELQLFLDNVPATNIITVSDKEKKLHIKKSGTGEPSIVRVTGARNWYSMCMKINYCVSGALYDCSGNCVDEKTVQARLHDGHCDDGSQGIDLRCEKFNYDGGDCGASGIPGESCGSASVYDCNSKCVDAAVARAKIGDGFCDDGRQGINLLCAAFNHDAGDCQGSAGDHGNTCGAATQITVNTIVSAKIDNPGDVDWFRVENPANNWLVVTTKGNTDTYGALYSQCDQPPFAQDDNSKDGINFQLYTLNPGVHYIEVRHSQPNGTGNYSVEVKTKPVGF